MAAIYTRVSSERQKEEHTIESQVAALVEYAEKAGCTVPKEWIFRDEGYSGTLLSRPGLDRLRDIAAEGQIEAILIYSTDRLSRKYAYQVLLIDEFERCGVELDFVKTPKATTPEESLLVQFQGIIAEYERAQITERTRRGKRHKAKGGSVNVLSGAPYGYRYNKKTEASDAYYQVIEEEAETVRQVYSCFTEEQMSINAIARRLNDDGVPTRKRRSPWCRSTIWAMLRNPAYMGQACYGKTEKTERKKITRPLRQRGGYSPRTSANREKPEKEWIAIRVPAIVDEESFAHAREKLEENKKLSPRRTSEPTLLQGAIVCNRCGYAYYRTSTRTSKRLIHYYRCLGSDRYRWVGGRKCNSQPIRQDYLDDLVWRQIIQLLGTPELIRAELRRRLEEISSSSRGKKRNESIEAELKRVGKSVNNLVDAYQEGLLKLEELRSRIPMLRKREKTLERELRSFENVEAEQLAFMKLAQTVEGFLSHLRTSAETMDILEQQKVLRLVVKEVLVDKDMIKIKHSIPVSRSGSIDIENGENLKSYLLRPWSHGATLRNPFPSRM